VASKEEAYKAFQNAAKRFKQSKQHSSTTISLHHFGDDVDRILKNSNMTIDELAEKINKTPEFINDIIISKLSNVSISDMLAIANALGCKFQIHKASKDWNLPKSKIRRVIDRKNTK